MASYRKRNGSWQAQVRKKDPRTGVLCSDSASFTTKAEATAWAVKTESEIAERKYNKIADIPVKDLLLRYYNEVSTKKAGMRWEQTRLKMFMRMDIADVRLPVLNKTDIAKWRDKRLEKVQGESVRREWTLLNNAFWYAINEWGLLDQNPMETVKRPPKGDPRDVIFEDHHLEEIIHVSGYSPNHPPETKIARMTATLLFCVETAIRSGEASKILWGMVGEDRVSLPREITKTRKPRTVPLSAKAQQIIKQMKEIRSGDSVFQMTSDDLTNHFAKARGKSSFNHLTFRDSRATALTRLAEKIPNPLDLAKISGHQDLNILMNTYYRPSADDLAAQIID